jgi:hypothetical protein
MHGLSGERAEHRLVVAPGFVSFPSVGGRFMAVLLLLAN